MRIKRTITILLLSTLLFFGPLACKKSVATQPTGPPPSTQPADPSPGGEPTSGAMVITDETLRVIATQTERGVAVVRSINAAKRGAFRDKLITARQARPITVASQKTLTLLEELNDKVLVFAELPPEERASIPRLLSEAVNSAKNLSAASLIEIKDARMKGTVDNLLRQLDEVIGPLARLLQKGGAN